MKVSVKLYGALEDEVPGYDNQEGLLLDLPEGARVLDLLARLELPEGVCSIDSSGRVLRAQDKLSGDASLKIFRIMSGG